jgi:hypothetical protein
MSDIDPETRERVLDMIHNMARSFQCLELLNGVAMGLAGDGLTQPIGPAISQGMSEIANAISEGLSEVAYSQKEGLDGIAQALHAINRSYQTSNA